MTESLKQQLLTACAFAKVFLQRADEEIRGGEPEPRYEAVAQLAASLSVLYPLWPALEYVDYGNGVFGFEVARHD